MLAFLLLGFAMLPACIETNSTIPESTGLLTVGPTINLDTPNECNSIRREPIRPLTRPTDLSPKKVELGKSLFHDTRLSHDNSVSCATCHDVENGGDDDLPTSVGIGGQTGDLNAPTVLNSGMSIAQFWDGRAASLEIQAEAPIHDLKEMGSNWEEVIGKLKLDANLVSQFQAIYPQGLNAKSICDAIANYERALVTVDSDFDKYLRGDSTALNENALAGYELFKSIGCISCHQGRLVGGNMFQEFGIMRDFAENFDSGNEKSKGRFNVTSRRNDLHRFKVPSLRNVQQTAPYFHDGQTATLEEAISIMAEFQLGESLSDQQITQIREFLDSLTGYVSEELQ